MPESSNDYVTVFSVEYDANVFNEEDIANLKNELETIGKTRVRAYQGPAAGGPAIWAVVEFIGLSAAAGLVGQLAVDLLKGVAKKLISSAKREPRPINLYDNLTIKFDDLDISISLVGAETIEKLPQILSDVREHLSSPPLSQSIVNSVSMPMELRDGKWRNFSVNWSDHVPEYPYKYWDIGSRTVIGETGIYDVQNRVFIKPIYETDADFLTNLIEQNRFSIEENPRSVLEAVRILRSKLIDSDIHSYSDRISSLASALRINLGRDNVVDMTTVEHLLFLCEWADSFSFDSSPNIASELRECVDLRTRW